ncbi:MAG: hypothetical protein ABEN55_17710, partial [Bradymonadaceae bacterium]
HTPPLDPKGLRDRGFRSRTEGSRTLSVLSQEGTDFLAAGHVPGPTVETYGDLKLAVPPAGGGDGLSMVRLAPRKKADGTLNVEVTNGKE